MATILVLEDSQVLLNRLTQELKQELLPLDQVLAARNIQEAQVLLDTYSIDAFVLDILLPDGNGLDFLCDVKTILPNAISVVMTASDEPGLASKAEELGILKYYRKPIDGASIARVLQKPLHGEEAVEDNSFHASLSALSTIDIIQLKCMGRATQVLQFRNSDGASGKIHFNRGEIVHAETPDHAGMRAFITIVGWKGGRVIESPEPISSQPSIQDSWQNLLMEAVRLIDEGMPAAA